jgi:hypothetical protein
MRPAHGGESADGAHERDFMRRLAKRETALAETIY